MNFKITPQQLERIIEVHSSTKGIVNTAIKVLLSEGCRISNKNLVAYWTDKGLSAISYTDFVHMSIKKYAKIIGRDPEKVAYEVNRELKPYSSVNYETVKKYMTREGLYTPQKNGGARSNSGRTSIISRRRKLSKAEKYKYKFYGAPETISAVNSRSNPLMF